MNEARLFYPYSEYLKKEYGEKVYKLPVNLPLSCPNRKNGKGGCSFCAEIGTGFEAMDASISVIEQLNKTKEYIRSRYHAHKFIAYFQNYTNTYVALDQFRAYLLEAASCSDLVEIAISTRPDCISEAYLQVLADICSRFHLKACIELGLQTVNYKSLDAIKRGHSLAEFIDAVALIQKYDFQICAHMILNLPGDDLRDCIEGAKILSALRIDIVKLHSLYIAKATSLCKDYEDGKISLCTKEEYYQRVIVFLEYLNPNIAVERLFSRAPKEETVFCNWGSSWWKLRDELLEQMMLGNHYQGKAFDYLGGAALRSL